MRKKKVTKKKGKLQLKRIRKHRTQSKPEMNQRSYENRSRWIERRDKKK